MFKYVRGLRRGFSSIVPLDKSELEKHGIFTRKVHRNLASAKYYESSLTTPPANPGTAPSAFTNTGAYAAYTGEKLGRSALDKRVVTPEYSDDDSKIWWGTSNVRMDREIFDRNLERAIDYLNNRNELFVIDGFAGSDPKYRKAVRVFCTRPYHALFMSNMLIKPHTEELRNKFHDPDIVIYNAGEFYAHAGTTRRKKLNRTKVKDLHRSGRCERNLCDPGHAIRR